MPEANRKPEKQESDLGLEGFEQIFDSQGATNSGESYANAQLSKLTDRLGELITLTVDQRVETSRISNQLIENQRQLVATQQILIRLMERSIELTRHVTTMEEKLPAVFELPHMMEAMRQRLIQLEGVEID
ncbi:MAG: hypothetical protein U0105_08760 [Candidatus Obscuribacterales bacterium]|jgi:hypothetical protein